MSDFFKSKGFAVLVALTIVVALLAAVSSSGDNGGNIAGNVVGIVASSIQEMVTSVRSGMGRVTGYFTRFDDLERENAELKAKVSELEKKWSDYEQYETEKERLRGLLGLKEQRTDFVFEAAEVVAREPGNWYDIFVIDKGTLSGIEKNMPVITDEGLVGCVIEAGTNWAKISTVLETDVTVGAIISRTRDIGVVGGDFMLRQDGLCRMSYIAKNANIVKGDIVETSGLGEVYPKGLIIGRITEVGLESHGISQYAVVQPSADLDALKEVFIIKSFSRGEEE